MVGTTAPVNTLIDIFLHLDQHLGELTTSLGGWTYVVLILIIFCETGLVVMPFLPGDSLLFAVGALCAIPESNLNLGLMMVLLCVAAILGDAVNYAIGRHFGPRVFASETSRFLNKKHLEYTARFYARHGGKTIILARFIPIIRTFAPFVAGIGKMDYRRFAMFNVVGGIAWVVGFLTLGYAFGNLPFVKDQFHYVILGIIVVSVMPAVIEFLRSRGKAEPVGE
ncbi:DedA family protein [Aeoliella sp. SH292]|uniref:DedA family protein n=1 Tax=Aeoliella sp. SH292 TaxID=3454464 RepID=UPI003F99A6FB